MVCDYCDGSVYTDDNPYVEVRIPRPSDPRDLSCVMAGHAKCASSRPTPQTGVHGGIGTPEQWEAFMESPEARQAGLLWLS